MTGPLTTRNETDWYAHPLYYDIIFDGDTGREADFLEAVLDHYGPKRAKAAEVLEPACGSGRLVIELARRGHTVDGFDLSRPMLNHARLRRRGLPEAIRKRISLREARMQSFRPKAGHYDLVHCLLSTFKYLLTEADATAHLRRVGRALRPGGLYVLGVHLSDYRNRGGDHERWIGRQDGIRVTCDTDTGPPDPAARIEHLTNRLRVRRAGTRRTETITTTWACRTYDAGQLRSLIEKTPGLEVAGCHDFSHQLNCRRAFDDAQDDLVLVLRKQPT